MHYIKRRIIPPIEAYPDKQRIADEGKSKRCVVCRLRWPVGDFVMEDGVEYCIRCATRKPESYQASELQKATARSGANLRKMVKQGKDLSQFPLEEPIPGVLNLIQRADGSTVYSSSPLNMTRNTAVTLKLKGVRFSSTDTISYSTGITDSVSPVITSTLITLSLIAALAMTPGTYNLTFNSHVYRGVFVVR